MANTSRKKPARARKPPAAQPSAPHSDSRGDAPSDTPDAGFRKAPVAEPAPQAVEREVRDQLTRQTAPSELDSPVSRKNWKLEELAHDRGPYLVELNVQYVSGLQGAAQDFLDLFEDTCRRLAEADGVPVPDAPVRIGKSYYRCIIRVKEWRKLIADDERVAAARAGVDDDVTRHRCIYRVWPDFPIKPHISRSVATIKADAAERSFEATGEEVVWAVIDSGVSVDHAHFGRRENEKEHTLLHSSVKALHRCFAPTFRLAGRFRVQEPPLADPDLETDKATRDALLVQHRDLALQDDFGHGSHVAGIIAGKAPEEGAQIALLQREDRINEQHLTDDLHARIKVTRERRIDAREAKRFHGIARNCRIVSLRVLDENGEGRSSDVIRALEYIRETLNDNPKVLRVHGVNLSVGYEFEAEMFACGQSPICSEVNRLVQAGVVVVTAAGNTGYGAVQAQARATKVGLSNTINDPGNAELAITVGATHRESPHTYGVSYFSSKGPTGDGRLKPDIVAPGERIVSCAAGGKLRKARQELQDPPVSPPQGTTPAGSPTDSAGATSAGTQVGERAAAETVYYAEDTGTSMAAPHVSGAIAAFLSIRREFIGRPLDVKRIFLESAIPLGRERYFEGHGLLDLMRAIQSV